MQSLRSIFMKILIPISFALAGLLVFLVLGMHENRKLADKYIYDTADLFVQQINKNMFQINSELIVFTNKNANVRGMPDNLSPQSGEDYDLIKLIMEQNSILKIRYEEVQNFYTYNQSADVLITDEGAVFHESTKSPLSEKLMDFLVEHASVDSLNTQWVLMQADGEAYIVSWYAKNKRAMGCVVKVDTIFKILQEATESYQVIPFMEDNDKTVLIPANVREEYRDSQLYSFQLGNVGQINLYVLPDGGILENLLNMQMFFAALVVVLLAICGMVAYSYYHRIMEPMKRFVSGLERVNEEQMLNENGTNNLLELEAVSDKFRELLRKIQSLKIAVYEEELSKQKAELEYVQEQIKPHFFLNCLSLIHGIADTVEEKEILYITEVLSDYMRYIFKETGQKRRVGDEIDHVCRYMEIQKLRYGKESFRFEVIRDGEVDACLVPSLLIQTLVENSIVHGVTMDHGIGISVYITFETYEEDTYLYISVSDTGKGFSNEILEAIENEQPIVYNGRKHVGLQNIKQRIKLMYGRRGGIEFSNMDEDYGAVVEVRIPQETGGRYTA